MLQTKIFAFNAREKSGKEGRERGNNNINFTTSRIICDFSFSLASRRRFSDEFYNFFPFCLVPPDILDYPTSTDMVVREGSNVTLKCAATGSPSPNIVWRREGGEKIMLFSGNDGKLSFIG